MCRGPGKQQKEERIGGGPYVSSDYAMLRSGSKGFHFFKIAPSLLDSIWN